MSLDHAERHQRQKSINWLALVAGSTCISARGSGDQPVTVALYRVR